MTEVLLPQDSVDGLAVGDRVKVRGRSKGRGFTGVVKRHHFRGGPQTHGQSDRQRATGAIGSTTTPGRVLKGKRLAGRSGFVSVSIKTKILAVNAQKRTLSLSGALPGHYGSLLLIEKLV